MAEEKSRMPTTVDEKLECASRLKEEGNQFFREQNFGKALSRYTKMFLYINGLMADGLAMMVPASSLPQTSEQQSQSIRQLQISAHLNSAACHLKLNQYDAAVKSSNKVLELDAGNSKALFRRAQAYNKLNNIDAAQEDLTRLLQLNPNDPLIRAEMQQVKQKLKQHQEKERRAFARMFEQSSSD
eukprot:TRINITY_DN4091_c0_g1_i3.p1 TRINITY_DN4091_c0_g1~~TRINITY_DN4091_c0_g1_i3.p1  ORF type:complete len:185 (+),score=48.51 TRINITY_DN4091_c0_g1_i3:74-628(+)